MTDTPVHPVVAAATAAKAAIKAAPQSVAQIVFNFLTELEHIFSTVAPVVEIVDPAAAPVLTEVSAGVSVAEAVGSEISAAV